MGLLYKDELLDGRRAIAYIPYGGPDFGEIAAVARAVGEGGADVFHEALGRGRATAVGRGGGGARHRPRHERARALPEGQRLLRGSLHPLFGAPVDPRLVPPFASRSGRSTAVLRSTTRRSARGDPVRGRDHARLFHPGGRFAAGHGRRSSSPTATTARSPTSFRVRRRREPTRLSQPSVRRAGAGRDAVRGRRSAPAGLGDGGRRRSSTSR